MMTASLQHMLRAAGMAVASAFVTTLACGQAVTLTPSPPGLHEEVTLTIDVGQSEQFGLKAILEANPGLPVYIWTWAPSDPVGTNGSWDSSNDDMQLVHQGGLTHQSSRLDHVPAGRARVTAIRVSPGAHKSRAGRRAPPHTCDEHGRVG